MIYLIEEDNDITHWRR